MLNPLAPTFSAKQPPKLYSLGRHITNQDMEHLESTDAPIGSCKVPPPNAVCSSQLVEQIQSWKTQMNHLMVFSESNFEQTTPLIQKVPLAHLKQVKYIQAVQLTVVQLHQHLKSERLER